MKIQTTRLNVLTDEFLNQYDDLLQATAIKHKVHLRGVWLKNYVRYYLSKKALSIFAVYQGNVLIGCLPMYVEEVRATRFWNYNVLRIIGNGPTDFFDILAKKGSEKIVVEQVFDFLQRNNFWDRFELTEIPETSPFYSLLTQSLNIKKINYKVDFPNGFYFIDTKKESWEDYNIKFNQNNKDLQKSERRIVADNITLSIQKFHSGVYKKLVENIDLYAIRRASLKQKNTYETQEKNKFLEAVITEKEKNNSVELTQLVDVDGVVWAFQLDWIDNKIRYHWNHAYNESFKRYSPGKLILKEIMKESFVNPDILECNYMRGLSDYKSKLVDQKTMYFRIIMDNPKSIKLKLTNSISSVLKRLKN